MMKDALTRMGREFDIASRGVKKKPNSWSFWSESSDSRQTGGGPQIYLDCLKKKIRTSYAAMLCFPRYLLLNLSCTE